MFLAIILGILFLFFTLNWAGKKNRTTMTCNWILRNYLSLRFAQPESGDNVEEAINLTLRRRYDSQSHLYKAAIQHILALQEDIRSEQEVLFALGAVIVLLDFDPQGSSSPEIRSKLVIDIQEAIRTELINNVDPQKAPLLDFWIIDEELLLDMFNDKLVSAA